MLKSFQEFIYKEKLFNANDKILLAVSGGHDSIVMCELFCQSKYNFAIAHCNFHLRGTESDIDEDFVKKLSEKYKVPYYNVHFNTNDYAKSQKISIEMAARNLRYEWFEKLLKKENYDYFATGHHLDDQIETLFINLLRGTGIAGLHGILPKQNHCIRPLLFTFSKDIKAFIKKNNLLYRQDSSNKSLNFTRNKIRHIIIPELEKINPDFRKSITNTIKYIKGTEIVYKNFVEQKRKEIFHIKNDRIYISINEIKKINPVNTFLYEFLMPYNFNSSVTDDIINSLDDISGKQFFSSSHRLIKDRENLIITKKTKTSDINIRQYFINKNTLVIEKPVKLKMIRIKWIKNDKNVTISKDRNIASIDFDKLKFPLKIKKWKQGDFFYPLGTKCKKKLSDFFIDNKLSIIDKEDVWLICSANRIVWIIGYRIDDRFKITNNTRNIYQIEFC
jgi:tRNA(Ile)-lysidine synthase